MNSLRLLPLLLVFFSVSLCASPPNPNDSKYDWMDKLVEKNFSPYKSGITQRQINRTEHSHGWLVRLKVINNTVHQDTNEKGAAFGMLEYLCKTYGLPDLDLLYYQQDGLWTSIKGGAPILCPSKKKWVTQGIYFIDWLTKLPHPKWDKIIEEINAELDQLSFETRHDQLIWRGTATDGYYTKKEWMNCRRGQLCYLSLQYPELIDARFVGISPYACKNVDEIWSVVPQGSWMSHAEQTHYKYQIILDGLFTTFPGDRWRLLSHSVVFMHESTFGHWFHEALIPWVHYVPVRSDLRDLVKKLIYVKEHPQEARQLADNARAFALNFLLTEQIAVYCYKVLLKYASLQCFTPQL